MNKVRQYCVEEISEKFRNHFIENNEGLLSKECINAFRRIIRQYYKTNARDFPWRRTSDPYQILVSEIMLQQTQTSRVTEIFMRFMKHFPTLKSLAEAPLNDLLSAWQGMGYNRRALYLQRAARQICEDYNGIIPNSEELLKTLPGIGPATASAICAYAFNMPVAYIETNIRTVFIHFFFYHHSEIPDSAILPLVKQTVPKKNARNWYSALMDYGVMLKQKYPNPGRKSAHHQKQTPFHGSRRQLRGKILRLLLEKKEMSFEEIIIDLKQEQTELFRILDDLRLEGLVKEERGNYSI